MNIMSVISGGNGNIKTKPVKQAANAASIKLNRSQASTNNLSVPVGEYSRFELKSQRKSSIIKTAKTLRKYIIVSWAE